MKSAAEGDIWAEQQLRLPELPDIFIARGSEEPI